MKYIYDNRKQVIALFLGFWILPAIMLVFSAGDNYAQTKIEMTCNSCFEESIKIMINNLRVVFIILISGMLYKYVSICIFGYNSLFFAIVFMVSIEEKGIIKTVLILLPHALIEVGGLSLFTLLGKEIKMDYKKKEWKQSVALGVLIIICAAFIEGYISKSIGVLI